MDANSSPLDQWLEENADAIKAAYLAKFAVQAAFEDRKARAVKEFQNDAPQKLRFIQSIHSAN